MTDLEHEALLVAAEDVTSADAQILIDELSAVLAAAYGSSGRSGFDPSAERDSVFLVAREGRHPVGCGALRPLPAHSGVAEIKRMYSRPGTTGVGRAILAALEAEAAKLGYEQIWLETRRANNRAVGFYERAGFVERAPYGRYVGRPEAICMEKKLGR
jgi:GNAT superfamily N-acetyltransferase